MNSITTTRETAYVPLSVVVEAARSDAEIVGKIRNLWNLQIEGFTFLRNNTVLSVGLILSGLVGNHYTAYKEGESKTHKVARFFFRALPVLGIGFLLRSAFLLNDMGEILRNGEKVLKILQSQLNMAAEELGKQLV